MPTELPLPKFLSRARWKVKILEKETREPPHVSILRGTDKWRIDLRTGEFLDRLPKPSEVPAQLLDLIRQNWYWLRQEWDRKYRDNPVASDEDPSDGNEHDSADAP